MTGAENIQDEPGASYSARKFKSAKNKQTNKKTTLECFEQQN